MTEYRCFVMDRTGKTAWRTIDAAAREAVVARLIADGVTPLDIRTGTPTLSERLNQPVRLGKHLRVGEQALILNQLATLVRAGLPIDRSLDLIREQAARAAQKQVLERAVAQLREGASLAATFENLESFPDYVIGVLRAAERGGDLAEALESIARRLAAAADARRQLIAALSYPLAVLAATGAALFLVLTQVVPQFVPVFAGEESRLPMLTRVVLWLSDLVNDHLLPLGLVVALVAIAGIFAWRFPPTALTRPAIRRLVPGLALRDQYLAGQLVGVLGTLVRNGVPVASALPLARGASSSATWRARLTEVERKVREGTRLSAALAAMDLIPSAAVRLIEVGEHSGTLAQACAHGSDVIATAAKARLDRIIAFANPIAIITLGGLVGSLVAGVMLGIFSLGDFTG